MGFLEVLTLVFVGCKLTGNVDWSWWAVFAPMYLYIPFIALFLLATAWKKSRP